MKLYYPAIFIKDKDGYTVEFPDLPGCVTQGDTLEEAFEMAEDAASGWILTSIEDGEDILRPSSPNSFNDFDGFVNYISLDIEAYAKKYSTKSVKKTLTIPEWLNTLAEKENINFSQELQRALKERLGFTVDRIEECVTLLQESAQTIATLPSTLISEYMRSDAESVSENCSDKVVYFPANLCM